MNIKIRAKNQHLSINGSSELKSRLEKLAKKYTPEYASGVYEAAIKSDYTSTNSSDAYDEYGIVFEEDVIQLTKLIN